jgi:hypothetical protein
MEQVNDDDEDGDVDGFSSEPNAHPVIEIDPCMKVPTPDITPPHRKRAPGNLLKNIKSQSPDVQIGEGYYIPPSGPVKPSSRKPSSSREMKVSARAGKARAPERGDDEMDVDVPAVAAEGMAVDNDPLGTRDRANRMVMTEQMLGANKAPADPNHGMMTEDLPAVANPVPAQTLGAGSSSAADIYNPPPYRDVYQIYADREHVQNTLQQKVCGL